MELTSKVLLSVDPSFKHNNAINCIPGGISFHKQKKNPSPFMRYKKVHESPLWLSAESQG
jgi:hypothetical protein